MFKDIPSTNIVQGPVLFCRAELICSRTSDLTEVWRDFSLCLSRPQERISLTCATRPRSSLPGISIGALAPSTSSRPSSGSSEVSAPRALHLCFTLRGRGTSCCVRVGEGGCGWRGLDPGPAKQHCNKPCPQSEGKHAPQKNIPLFSFINLNLVCDSSQTAVPS